MELCEIRHTQGQEWIDSTGITETQNTLQVMLYRTLHTTT